MFEKTTTFNSVVRAVWQSFLKSKFFFRYAVRLFSVVLFFPQSSISTPSLFDFSPSCRITRQRIAFLHVILAMSIFTIP